MVRRLIAVAFLIALPIVSCPSVGEAQDKTENPIIQTRSAKFKEIYDRLQPVHIYGKVVDQDGSAVVGADIRINWESADFLVGKRGGGGQTLLKSDGTGAWEFKIDKPHRAFVNEVIMPGYEYTTRYNQKSSVRNLVENRTTRDEPVVTVLRKKGETTFLIVDPSGNRIGNQLIRVLSPDSQTKKLDLLSEKGAKPTVTENYEDLEVAVNYEPITGKWTVTYSTINVTDGIVIGNDLLYEAPSEGYQRRVVLDCPIWPRYLYLRSRTPAVYSRLDLEHSIWRESKTQEGLRISYKAWINPYGERNLEYEVELEKEWRLADRLEQDAKILLRQNKRPAVPDLQRLIKDAKTIVNEGK